ncbi:MAG: amidohydrolase [Spirochaetaceae bacterium]|nr:amidohydrolase [Spirochaetaceae bacterium]
MVIAELVLKNGKVATLDKHNTFHQAVAVKDGWIIDVGSNDEISARIGPATRVIDLGGKVLLPAANDAHLHATLTGLMLDSGFLQVGTPDIKTVKDLQKKIAAAVAGKKPGQWIYGSGFLEFLLEECAAEGRGLNRWDLDPVSPDNPVMLTDFGLHTLVVNSRALEAAGIDKNFRALAPEEGILERDPKTGEPNGRLLEWSAHHLIGNHCPVVSEEELETLILRVQKALNEQGAASHNDIIGRGLERIFFGVGREKVLHVYEKLRREGKLTARVSIAINPCIEGIEDYEHTLRGIDEMSLPVFEDRNWVKADAVKLFGDQGIWLRPREDRPEGTGRSVFPGQTNDEQAENISRTIIELHRRGWQVCIHAIGGKTIDTAIDAFAQAQEMFPRETPRHYIIHADDMTVENAGKMSRYNIGASPQPIAANIVAGMNAPRLTAGEELFNWQAYIDKGVPVAGGSDSPCFSFNWREGVQFAVTRTTMAGQQIRPDLAMKLEDAIRMYTVFGAYQEHMENVRGTIEINKVADFQVLGRDIFTTPPNEIANIPVVMTICAGKIVFEKN